MSQWCAQRRYPRSTIERIATSTVVHPTLGTLTVGPVPAASTYALRQAVLRPRRRIEEMAWLDSGHVDSLVVGACTAAGEVMATGSVMPETPPELLASVVVPGARMWRLRAMATHPDGRSGGLGGAVLAVLMEHVERQSAGRDGAVIWCSARVPAIAFYERVGFRSHGDTWVDEEVGPHVYMWCDLSGARRRQSGG